MKIIVNGTKIDVELAGYAKENEDDSSIGTFIDPEIEFASGDETMSIKEEEKEWG